MEDEFISLEVSLGDPDVVGDHAELRRVSKRYKDLTPVVECVRAHRKRSADAQAARELLVDASESDRQMLRTELAEAEEDLAALEEQLRLLMLPKDPNDGKAVIMEIRGAAGGEEGNQHGDADRGSAPQVAVHAGAPANCRQAAARAASACPPCEELSPLNGTSSSSGGAGACRAAAAVVSVRCWEASAGSLSIWTNTGSKLHVGRPSGHSTSAMRGHSSAGAAAADAQRVKVSADAEAERVRLVATADADHTADKPR